MCVCVCVVGHNNQDIHGKQGAWMFPRKPNEGQSPYNSNLIRPGVSMEMSWAFMALEEPSQGGWVGE